MLLELNASTQAMTNTGKAVAIAKTIGNSQPPVVVAESGINIPK